jgi:DNA-directed RNA polymerase specialized sigma24 family protein
MPGPASDFSRLMQRVAEGDPNAFTELFHLYNPVLLAQLRGRLKKIHCLRSLLEPDDLAQNIWMGFFAGSFRRRQFSTRGHFLRYLARTARYQILKSARDHLGVQKRDARRCCYLSETGAAAAAIVITDPSPTPDWIAEVADECDRGIRSLTGGQQQMSRMMRSDLSYAKMIAELGCSERRIERIMGEIRRALSLV